MMDSPTFRQDVCQVHT